MGRGSSKIGGGGNFKNADDGQIAMMNKLKQEMTVGKLGVGVFGGYGWTISETPTFKMRNDGMIEYRVVSTKNGKKRIQTGRILKNANGTLRSLISESVVRS